MSVPIRLLVDAEEEVEATVSYYEDQEPGLGEDFQRELDLTFERISFMPLSFPLVRREARFCRVRRFPFIVYYRVKADHVEVIAVQDGRRKQYFWRRKP